MFQHVTNRLSLGADRLRRKVATIRGKGRLSYISGAGTIHIRPNSTDYRTFAQVFHQKEYDFTRFNQYQCAMQAYERILAAQRIPVIIDAGANVGAASIWFAKQFPKAQILAVEPDPDNAAICRLNTADLAGVKLMEGAVGSVGGRVTLTNPYNEEWAVQTVRGDSGSVFIYTIPDLVHAAGPAAELFVVKIDIEGFEDDLFRENTGWIDDATVIIIEPHDWLFAGKGRSFNFQRAMARSDFELLISGENLVYVRLPSYREAP